METLEKKVDRLLKSKSLPIQTPTLKHKRKIPKRLLLIITLVSCCSIASAVVINNMLSNKMTMVVTFDPPSPSLLFEQSYNGSGWTQNKLQLVPNDESIVSYLIRITNTQDSTVDCRLRMTVTNTPGFTIINGTQKDINSINLLYGAIHINLLDETFFTSAYNANNTVLTLTSKSNYQIPVGTFPTDAGTLILVVFNSGAKGTYALDIEAVI